MRRRVTLDKIDGDVRAIRAIFECLRTPRGLTTVCVSTLAIDPLNIAPESGSNLPLPLPDAVVFTNPS